jgi:predicted transcriptional regulator
MNVKERIKKRVNDINDPQLLDELLKAVELEYEIEHIDELTEIEKKAIDEGISDAEAGNLHSNTDASQLVKEWLKK